MLITAFDPVSFSDESFDLQEFSGVDPAFSAESFDKLNAFSPDAFSFGDEPPTPPDGGASTGQLVGGGAPSHGTLKGRRRDGRSRREIEEDRARFGLPAKVAEVVATVAARQAETLVQDQQKQFDELLGEITLQGLEFEARYLEALNIERQRLIDQEIGLLIKRKLDDEVIMLLLAAAAAAS